MWPKHLLISPQKIHSFGVFLSPWLENNLQVHCKKNCSLFPVHESSWPLLPFYSEHPPWPQPPQCFLPLEAIRKLPPSRWSAAIDYGVAAATNKPAELHNPLVFILLCLCSPPLSSSAWKGGHVTADSTALREREFTAGCSHLLQSRSMMFGLLHLRQGDTLYCKCTISIHEGIYMHSRATLPVFILHVPRGKSYRHCDALKRNRKENYRKWKEWALWIRMFWGRNMNESN